MNVVSIVKRDGRELPFEPKKITDAIMKAVMSVGGEDRAEAERMTGIIVDRISKKLEASGETKTNVEDVQDIVEKVLIEEGHATTAKAYILYRANRSRIRNMDSNLMRVMQELTYGSSNDVEIKRENANIDGETAMGTMLRYGSEAAKAFNLDFLASPEIARAHRVGDIHIHDLDFMALTETCVTADTKVLIREGNKNKIVKAEYFEKYLKDQPVDTVVYVEGIQILCEDKMTKLINCVKHDADKHVVYEIQTVKGKLRVTDNHVVTIIRDEEQNHDSEPNVIDVKAEEIKVGDLLVYYDTKINGKCEIFGAEVTSIEKVDYKGYVYDFETATHYFNANGFKVHNCCQIDLEKLFEGGFNTGHGQIREPGEIRSYGALACIAIQGNQNEMHKPVAV